MDFPEKLTVLVATELALANRDPERLAVVMAKLAEQLGHALAVAFRDDQAALDRVATGLEATIHRHAVLRVEMIRALGGS